MNLLKRSNSDLSEVIAEVLLFVVLDHLEHVSDSSMEVLLHIQLLVSEVVDQSSLLNIVVLTIDANVFHLLLGVSEVSKLLFLSNVSPLAAELLGLIARVDVVENCELRTNEVGEVTDFNIS